MAKGMTVIARSRNPTHVVRGSPNQAVKKTTKEEDNPK